MAGNAGEPWGPSHQHIDPPFRRRSHPIAGLLVGVPLLLVFLEFLRSSLGFGGDVHGLIGWTIAAAIALVLLRVGLMLFMSVLTRPPRLSGDAALGKPRLRPTGHSGALTPVDRKTFSPATLARQATTRLGGGAYLGSDEHGAWVTADPESAVMVLGPPRSGKTSAVMIPALMCAVGAAVSTSTKPDVMRATLSARSELGQAWLFDPSGTESSERLTPGGLRRLCWSPVAAAATWDGALVMARAMTAATRAGAGTTNENHWTERAAALLAPLLYAARQTDRPIAEVQRWTLRQDLAPALSVLADSEAQVAADVLTGIERTDGRERSSIFSATAGVLAAYNSDAVRTAAGNPNFDPARFASSTDTIYITAPEHKQALCAPLIVGLLEQVRHAVYERARTDTAAGPPMLWALDEIANTAPIHDLPALVSQAGGQNLQVMIGLQDLSQARARWGDAGADGLMSLFQTKLILTGIADARTLESISLALGEYDRGMASQSLGNAAPEQWSAIPTHSETVSYQTQRHRILTPGEIARLPDGRGLLLQGADWQAIRLTKWYETQPWRRIGVPATRSQTSRGPRSGADRASPSSSCLHPGSYGVTL